MKKFQTMMAVVLVTLMAFAVQSCGSDNDDQEYKLDVTLNITDRGPLTDAECEAMLLDAAKASTVISRPTDNSAEQATMLVAQGISEGLEFYKSAYGSAQFTYTITCTRISGDKHIISYYVTYNNGDVRIYSNKN